MAMDEMQREAYWTTVVQPGIAILRQEYSFDFAPIVYSEYHEVNFGAKSVQFRLDGGASAVVLNAGPGQAPANDRAHKIDAVATPQAFAQLIKAAIPPIVNELNFAIKRCMADARLEVVANPALVGRYEVRNRKNNATAQVFIDKDLVETRIRGNVGLSVLEKTTIEITVLNRKDIVFFQILASIGLGPS